MADQKPKTPEKPVTSYEKAHEVGYLGEKVDPTPNEHYTAPDRHTDPPKFSGPDLK